MKELVYGDPRVKPGSVAPVRSIPALFSNGTDSATLGLIGGELNQLDGIYNISGKTIEGEASIGNGEIMVGKEFAETYNLKPGDSVALALSTARPERSRSPGSSTWDRASSTAARRSSRARFRRPRWAGQTTSSRPSTCSSTSRTTPRTSQATGARSSPGVSVVEWQGQNAALLVGLTSQSASSYMIQGFVLVAVALGIASTLAIAAVQKTRQIGILKAMGLADTPAGRIFLFQAAILGVVGSILGVILSFGILALFRLSPAPFTIEMDPTFVAISMLHRNLRGLAVLDRPDPAHVQARPDRGDPEWLGAIWATLLVADRTSTRSTAKATPPRTRSRACPSRCARASSLPSSVSRAAASPRC